VVLWGMSKLNISEIILVFMAIFFFVGMCVAGYISEQEPDKIVKIKCIDRLYNKVQGIYCEQELHDMGGIYFKTQTLEEISIMFFVIFSLVLGLLFIFPER
jgi:hypothetical protein